MGRFIGTKPINRNRVSKGKGLKNRVGGLINYNFLDKAIKNTSFSINFFKL